MVSKIISLVKIKNNSQKSIVVSITPYFNSPIISPDGGDVSIPKGGEIEVEEARVGKVQLELLARSSSEIEISHMIREL